MSKRYVGHFLDAYAGVLADACAITPSLRKECDKDLVRLATLSSKHGDGFFTICLPAAAAVLDQSIDQGVLLELKVLGMGRINTRTRIPRLFKGIWLTVFDINGSLRHDVDPTFILILRQLLVMGKKYESVCPPKAVDETVRKFYQVESELEPPHPFWDADSYPVSDRVDHSMVDIYSDHTRNSLFAREDDNDQRYMLDLCQQVADRAMWATFGSVGQKPFATDTLTFRHGPGATSEFGRGRDYKYAFPTWNPRLESVWPYDTFGVANPAVLADQDAINRCALTETHSRLIAVPKTMKGPRLIAAEPVCNQWCQQSLANYVSEVLRSKGQHLGRSIDFRRQDLSGAAALTASRTLQYATLDLKDASDRLSTWHVLTLFRRHPAFRDAIAASRTRYLANTKFRRSPKLHKLRKFATMGSALTFPIQSIVFTILCLTACLAARGEGAEKWTDYLEEVRVFGDDLIVPQWAYMRVLKMLEYARFKVNADKSFAGSNLRESCGVDGFRGYDVTPVKLKTFADSRRPGSVISAVDSANLFMMKGLWHTAAAIRSSVDPLLSKSIGIVRTGSGVWGDKTFCQGPLPSPRKSRWNKDRQTLEIHVLQPKAVGGRSSRFEGYANLLQFFTEDPTSSFLAEWESGLFSVTEAGYTRRWVDLLSM